MSDDIAPVHIRLLGVNFVNFAVWEKRNQLR